jgi:hypothetical protein
LSAELSAFWTACGILVRLVGIYKLAGALLEISVLMLRASIARFTVCDVQSTAFDLRVTACDSQHCVRTIACPCINGVS